jgi:hypothetical protein
VEKIVACKGNEKAGNPEKKKAVQTIEFALL